MSKITPSIKETQQDNLAHEAIASVHELTEQGPEAKAFLALLQLELAYCKSSILIACKTETRSATGIGSGSGIYVRKYRS